MRETYLAGLRHTIDRYHSTCLDGSIMSFPKTCSGNGFDAAG